MQRDSIATVMIGRPQAFAPSPGVYTEARRGHLLRLGAIMLVASVQVTLYLESVVNSPILPGNWVPLQVPMQVDLIYTFMALGFIAALPLYSPALARGLKIQPGGVPGFLLLLPFGGFVAWVVTTLLTGGASSGLSPAQQLQQVVLLSMFVAPSEELFFRVAVANYFRTPWVGGVVSSVFFGIAHIFSYSSGGNFGVQLFASMGFAMLLGFGLWVACRKYGYGLSTGLHAGYDVALAGIAGLGTISILGVHLGPI